MDEQSVSGETPAGTVLVVEAALVDEAKTLLMHPEITIDVVLCAVDLDGSTDGFSPARWVRSVTSVKLVWIRGVTEKPIGAFAPVERPMHVV
jgi:hypothetical protein